MDHKAIQEELSSTIEILQELDKHLDEKFLIEGKTRREWRRLLEVKIPDEVTFADVVRLGAKLAKNYQIAAFHRDNQTLTIDVLARSRVDAYNERYKQVLDEHIAKTGKSLAAQSCKTKADLSVKEIDSAINAKTIVRDFWIKTCETLTEVRKDLEIIGKSLASESQINRDFVLKTRMPEKDGNG